MKSRISIEIDFENNNLPIIQILRDNSDDVRDKLIASFLQSLSHSSRWCTIEYIGESDGVNPAYAVDPNPQRWHIKPITIQQIPEEIKLMEGVVKECLTVHGD